MNKQLTNLPILTQLHYLNEWSMPNIYLSVYLKKKKQERRLKKANFPPLLLRTIRRHFAGKARSFCCTGFSRVALNFLFYAVRFPPILWRDWPLLYFLAWYLDAKFPRVRRWKFANQRRVAGAVLSPVLLWGSAIVRRLEVRNAAATDKFSWQISRKDCFYNWVRLARGRETCMCLYSRASLLP